MRVLRRLSSSSRLELVRSSDGACPAAVASGGGGAGGDAGRSPWASARMPSSLGLALRACERPGGEPGPALDCALLRNGATCRLQPASVPASVPCGRSVPRRKRCRGALALLLLLLHRCVAFALVSRATPRRAFNTYTILLQALVLRPPHAPPPPPTALLPKPAGSWAQGGSTNVVFIYASLLKDGRVLGWSNGELGPGQERRAVFSGK